MKQLQWSLVRRFSSYVKVPRPDSFKVVEKPLDEEISCWKVIDMKIRAGGPITVADYMRTVLTNPSIGYYMHRDMIGQKGDFITSPEITQLFGEMIAVWMYHEYRKIGAPKPWQVIELGPGKGTLMKDVLRTLESFNAHEDLSVHFVEVSPALSSIQSQSLCDDPISIGIMPKRSKENPYYKSSKTIKDVPVYWYEKIEQVPKGFSVVLAHEFFDALPIHKFQKVAEGWREVLINSTRDEKGDVKFEYVLSKNETAMSKLLVRKDETREHIEVCVEGGILAKHIAERLEESGGFALFVDYGHNGDKTDTLRAFKQHQLVDPLVNPGAADLTADVDFSFLRETMKDKLLIYGPVDQGDFLHRMGIKLRVDMMLKNAEEKNGRDLLSAYRRIADKDQMGSRYKCFAAFPAVLEEHVKPYFVEGFYEPKNRFNDLSGNSGNRTVN